MSGFSKSISTYTVGILANPKRSQCLHPLHKCGKKRSFHGMQHYLVQWLLYVGNSLSKSAMFLPSPLSQHKHTHTHTHTVHTTNLLEHFQALSLRTNTNTRTLYAQASHLYDQDSTQHRSPVAQNTQPTHQHAAPSDPSVNTTYT